MSNRKRKRMKRFTITEISAVDTPAQVGARVTLMKRHDPEEDAIAKEAYSLDPDPDQDVRIFNLLFGKSVNIPNNPEVSRQEEALRDQGERMMEEIDEERASPEHAELTERRRRGVARFMANRSSPMTTKMTKRDAEQHGRDVLAKNMRAEAEATRADAFRVAVNKRAAELEKEGFKTPGRQAMQELREEDPEGFAAYQSRSDNLVRGDEIKATEDYNKAATAQRTLATKVEKAVNEVMARDGCNGQEALRTARSENPELFSEYYGH